MSPGPAYTALAFGYVFVAVFVQGVYERALRGDAQARPWVARLASRLNWSRDEVQLFSSTVIALFWPVAVPASVYWGLARRMRGALHRRRAPR